MIPLAENHSLSLTGLLSYVPGKILTDSRTDARSTCATHDTQEPKLSTAALMHEPVIKFFLMAANSLDHVCAVHNFLYFDVHEAQGRVYLAAVFSYS